MDTSTARTSEALRVAIGEFVRASRGHETMGRAPMGALGHLDREGPATIARLADVVHVRHQSMAKAVGQLAQAGEVEVAPHPTDGRSVLVSITDEGRALLNRERADRAAWIAGAMEAQLTAEERDQLAAAAELLARLARHALS